MVNVKKDSIEGRLIRVAEKVLVEEYTQRLSQDNFTWDQEVSSNIVKAYRTEYGVISPSDMKIINGTMDKKQWRWNQTGKARTKSKIGIVRPLTGGALAGEISATGRESALGTATRNAQKGQGPEMSIDLSLVDLGLMTKYLQQLQAHQEPDALPPHLMKFLMKDSDANDLRAVVANQFENVQEYLLDASGNNMNMSAADVLQPKHITDGKIDNLVKLINYGKDCANPESAREEGANLRKFGIATIREIMLGEECLLGSGKVVLLPMIVTLSTGKVLKFPALATMGFENESGDVLLDRMICPGMSNNHYESQSDNVQPILLDGYSIFVPSLGMHFHTNALSNSSGRIKLAEDRDSGEFGTVPVPVNGSDRLFKKLYPTAEEVGNTVKYKRHTISLPILERSKRPVRSAKATKSEKAVFRKVAHHRLNNLITDHIGTRGKDEELNALLKAEKVSCLEALLLATGESQVDYEEMLRKFNLTQEEVDSWEENVVREKVPQGQCDNDHFCHRNHPICNSHYAALPTSHTANTINSIIRRMNGDWCYGMSIHPYKDGS